MTKGRPSRPDAGPTPMLTHPPMGHLTGYLEEATMPVIDPTSCAHEWDQTAGTWTCTQCGTTTHACTSCHRPMDSELTVCDRCIHRAQRIIDDIRTWIDTIPFEHGVILGLRAVRYDPTGATTTRDAPLPFGLDALVEDPDDHRIAAAKTPDSAISVLHWWADTWAETRGDPHPNNALDYLINHTLWAMQNPEASAWTQYHDQARRVRSTVRRLLGIAPEREPVPCVQCGGTVIRDWTPDGLDDVRRCSRCRTEWATYGRLVHTNTQVLHALPQTHPNALVTTEQARRIWPGLNAVTIRSWIHRGHLTSVTHDVRGEPLYRLGDIAARHGEPDMAC